VDYSYAETFLYGKDQGCNFLDDYCHAGDGKPLFPEFCEPAAKGEPDKWGCQANYMGPGSCIPEKIDIPIESVNWNYHND
jgi:hypothetical protein